jgi:hypothetical protein
MHKSAIYGYYRRHPEEKKTFLSSILKNRMRGSKSAVKGCFERIAVVYGFYSIFSWAATFLPNLTRGSVCRTTWAVN